MENYQRINCKKENHFENLRKLINDTTDINKQNSTLANQFNNYFANVASDLVV